MATADGDAPRAAETLPTEEHDAPVRGGNRGGRRATPWLRRRRLELGWTLDELAVETGLSKGFLSQLERRELGARGPARAALMERLQRAEDILFEPASDVSQLTQKQAAAMLGKHPKHLRGLCDRGGLPRRQVDRAFVEALAELERELELDWWLLAEASRETGLEWWVFRAAIADERLEERRVGSRCYVRQTDARILAERLRAEAGTCPVCGKQLKPGRTLHQRCAGIARGAEIVGWWESEAGEVRKSEMREGAGGKVAVPCFICSRDVERWPHEVAEAAEGKHRTVCKSCGPSWSSYLMRARWAVAPLRGMWRGDSDGWRTLERLFGEAADYEEGLRASWPGRGRRPPLAADIAIEVLFADGFSDGRISMLLTVALAREIVRIPGLTAGATITSEYVKTRRKRTGVRRREAA